MPLSSGKENRLHLTASWLVLCLVALTWGAMVVVNRPIVAAVPQNVTWGNFMPTDWVLALPLTSSITAQAAADLDPATAAYAISTDAGATWSAWSTDGLTVSSEVNTTLTLTVAGLYFPDSADGNLIRFRIAEIGGPPEESPSYLIRVDATPPGSPVNLAATPATWANQADFALTWANPPDVSAITGAWYKLDQPPAGPTDGTFVVTTDIITGIAPAADGAHPAYVWLQDEHSRADQTTAAVTTLYLDRMPPLPPSGLQGNPARTWTNVNSFSETWTNPPDLSGIVGVYYRINRPGQFPTDGIFVSTTTTLTNIEVPADGKHDLYLWLVDAAGNVDHGNRNVDPQVFWYDGTPPVSMATLDPPEPAGGWYSTTVTIVFSAVDGPEGSGVDVVLNQIDGTGWSTLPSLQVFTEGIHTVEYYARDIAGNSEPLRALTVSLDFTPPVVSLTPQRPPQANGWYTAPVTLDLTASDPLSGDPVGYYRLNAGAWQTGSQIALDADGIYEIEYYGQDAAGNRTAIRSTQIKLDATPPTTAYLIEGTQGQNGWFTSPLTVRLIPSDATSGVQNTYYRINDGAWQAGTEFQLSSDGIYTLAFYSLDMAGNREASFPVQVKLDTVAPAAPTAVQTIPDSWSQANRFTVQWANPTDLSGISGVYYLLNREPQAPDDGILVSVSNRLENLALPGEGIYRLYLWLQDGAGNADHRNRALAPLLRYDATPPTTTLHIQGLPGNESWYRSAVTLTLSAVDAHSGVANTHYRLGIGNWTTGATLSLAQPGKYVLAYYSSDVAGNSEPVRQTTIRLDPDPPASPANLRAEPSGWQHYNGFRLLWREPLDQSGIAGAYIRFNSPPTNPADGVFYPASEVLEGLQVPGEGKHTAYVWLRDRAGNSDHQTAVALPEALWYDQTPPTTVVTITGNLGQNGWYRSPVAFTSFASDAASGVAETGWRLDEGPWSPGTSLVVDSDGQHIVQVVSVDVAGNKESPSLYSVAIDQQAPEARMRGLSHYQPTPQFQVSWWGSDPWPGSGLAGFDVQVRVGWEGTWQDWLTYTTLTSATFNGQRGHTYFFRARAYDLAGNVGHYTDGTTYAIVETVRNGSFDTGNFSEWETGGLLRKAVVPTEGPEGTIVLAARLGTPDYGPSIEEPGQVPVGWAAISQTITVPPLDQARRPTLTLWYRVLTYDVIFSQRLQRYIDTFEVTISSPEGQPLALLLRAGNPTNQYGQLYDTGWQWALLDLSPFAGQSVQLTLANHNREDNLFNTWSFVDEVRVQDWPYNVQSYLPLMAGGGSPAAASDITRHWEAAPIPANKR